MTEATDKLSTKTKLFYGVGDVGNAMVNAAVGFFLMVFYTDAALIGHSAGSPTAPAPASANGGCT